MLEDLLIANNAIGPAACVAIIVGIRECPTIRRVCMDGNVLGECGARALIGLPFSRSDGMDISYKNCDLLRIETDTCWFNPHGNEVTASSIASRIYYLTVVHAIVLL